jgi:hypothetical protein
VRDAIDPTAVFSAARVRGVTVLAVSLLGIVRVFSSRDDGETWTPSVVAYDREEYRGEGPARRTPTQLLGLDGRVLLYAGSDAAHSTYPVLASDDFGASWHAR